MIFIWYSFSHVVTDFTKNILVLKTQLLYVLITAEQQRNTKTEIMN